MSTTVFLSGSVDALRFKYASPLLVLLAAAACLSILGLRYGDRKAPHADVTTLPTVLGTWQMVASEQTDPAHLALSTSDLGALSLDSYTEREYQDTRSGDIVTLLLEYRTAGRGAFNHRPEACYPASGFVLTNRRSVPISYAGRDQSAVAMTADYSGSLGKSHQALLYWFARGPHAESSFWRQQVEMALGRLHPQDNGWAFVRLVSEVPPGSEAAGLAAEQDFARQASPALIRTISAGQAQ